MAMTSGFFWWFFSCQQRAVGNIAGAYALLLWTYLPFRELLCPAVSLRCREPIAALFCALFGKMKTLPVWEELG